MTLRPERFIAPVALLCALTLAGCAATNVSAYLASGADLGRGRSYDWAAADHFETGDPRLDNNPFFQARVKAAADKRLAARGFEKRTTGTAAFVLHYHANVKQEVDPNRIDAAHGYCDECTPYVYDAGTLVIDFVDARTDKLIWRGWAEGSIHDIDNQRELENEVDNAVARILAKLPPLS